MSERVRAVSDPGFPLYSVTYRHGGGRTTSLMAPWLFRTDPGHEVVRREALRRWTTVNWRPTQDAPGALEAIVVIRKPDVPWALGWFTHETYRAGRTDEELRESFERWVRRWEDVQDSLAQHPGVPCLMGAEDRWRWKDICRCERCRRSDKAFIGH